MKGRRGRGKGEEDQQHGGAHAEDQTPMTLLSGRACEVQRWLEMVVMVDGFGAVELVEAWGGADGAGGCAA